MFDWILLFVAVILCLAGFFWRKSSGVKKSGSGASPSKKSKRIRVVSAIIMLVGAYLTITCLINIIFGTRESHGLEFHLWPSRTVIWGFNVSVTVIYSFIASAALVLLAIVLRVTVVRNFSDVPSGVQNVLESVVDTVRRYTDSQAHGTGEFLCSYILTIGALMVACACFELVRLRAPTSDITMTFSLAFMTFIFINGYGISRKGALGRIKSLAEPTPVVFIFRTISEFAIPVSMACRLFGNMLGGMIVMDLLYTALGNGAVGIPSAAGLFFNVFHPLIQAFIFITLTLTFISEAIE